MLPSHSNATSVLLTDEAVRAVRDASAIVQPEGVYGPRESAVRAFLRYHATEGREALRDALRDAIEELYANRPPQPTYSDVAETVVTGLFGERD